MDLLGRASADDPGGSSPGLRRPWMCTSRSALLLVLLALIGIVHSQSAVAGTFPGANGRIAFVLDPNGIPRLATARTDGHDMQVLVQNPSGFPTCLCPNPNGHLMAAGFSS